MPIEERERVDYMLNEPMAGHSNRSPKATAESIRADTDAFLSAAGHPGSG